MLTSSMHWRLERPRDSTERARLVALTASGRSWIKRLVRRLASSGSRRAEEEITHALAMTGGKFTDEVERAPERRWSHSRFP